VIALFPETRAIPRTLQLVVPIAVPDAPVEALVHVTVPTPMLSDALPPRSMGDKVAVYVAEEVG
jgi:hypothetical protein